MRIRARTHQLLCFGIIGPPVRQKGGELTRGSNKDVSVCGIRQAAGVNAIYLRVALDEIWGYGLRHSSARRCSGSEHGVLTWWSREFVNPGAIGPEKEGIGATRVWKSPLLVGQKEVVSLNRAKLSSTAKTKAQAGFR